MSRIVNTGQTPAKRRHAHRRSCAEVLRLLAQKRLTDHFDDEAKDMVAFLVFNLRGIYQTIDESAHAWDEKNYWKKAETLRERWRWSRTAARKLEALVLDDDWDAIPIQLIGLTERFQDVTVRSITRNADWWCGALRALRREAAS
jgi:glycogen synthase